MVGLSRAVHCTRYGQPDVLELRQVSAAAPKPGQVLIRVHAATVTLGDCEIRAFKLADWIWVPARLAFGITRPRQPVLGMELAGEVVAIGEKVSRFKIGDRVFGSSGFAMGAYADYAAVPETASITTIPSSLTYAQVVGIPTGGFNGLHFVRQCNLKPGEKVLINGAGGSIGMFATQIAKASGAEVTAVDRAGKFEMLRRLGADRLIEFTETDFWATGDRYDAVIDVVGTSPFAPTVAALNHGGRYILGNPRAGQMVQAIAENRRGRVRAMFNLAAEPLADLEWLKQQVADGALQVIVDRTYALEQIREAHAYVESGLKTGIVVIDIGGEAGAPAGRALAAPAAR